MHLVAERPAEPAGRVGAFPDHERAQPVHQPPQFLMRKGPHEDRPEKRRAPALGPLGVDDILGGLGRRVQQKDTGSRVCRPVGLHCRVGPAGERLELAGELRENRRRPIVRLMELDLVVDEVRIVDVGAKGRGIARIQQRHRVAPGSEVFAHGCRVTRRSPRAAAGGW